MNENIKTHTQVEKIAGDDDNNKKKTFKSFEEKKYINKTKKNAHKQKEKLTIILKICYVLSEMINF